MTSQAKSMRDHYPRRWDIPFFILISVILLCVALSLPLFKVEKMILWKNEYSVLTGIIGLYNEKEYFLSAILFFFSIIFPFFKLFALWMLWQAKLDDLQRQKVFHRLAMLGRWSMLDVFVVAILIVAVKLGPMANVEPKLGVYIFTLAILATNLTTMWVERLAKKNLDS